ncbi:GNAT family N-acetyltransferase [Pseudomonas sp. S37]|nr:GNAT family N-acetyltransferase [Pseudomonas sp. S37]
MGFSGFRTEPSLYDQPGNNRGFWLAPQWWGKGYMREACRIINAYWFETLSRPVMRAPKAIANNASRKISEHEGMRLVEVRAGDFVSGPMEVEIWEMTRADWLEMAFNPDGASAKPSKG